MMSQQIWRMLYSGVVVPFIRSAAHLAALKNQNLNAGLQGRKGLWQRIEQQLARREVKKSLIWFHVASAGEFLQAQPVLERCLQQGYECAVTYTSVNGWKWIQRTTFPDGLAPIVKEYLPLDSAKNMRRMLHTLRPSLIVYVKYDLWPNLVWEAHAAGIPQYLISATLQPRSKRFTSALGRSFYRTLYACLDGIFAVTDDDRRRFLSTNPHHPNIQTVGDTRFDSVLDRKQWLQPPALPEYLKEKFVFIAGSSWPPDEQCIFPALKDALTHFPDLFVMIAPHEPTDEHLQHGERFFQGIPMARLTTLSEHPDTRVRLLFVDTVGVLSSLYAAGRLAYVGGAFTTGVHNVMEPCAMGLPVIFGPKYYNSPEAVKLHSLESAFSINDAGGFRSLLFQLLHAPERCEQLGRQAADFIVSRAGAADRILQLIHEKLL